MNVFTRSLRDLRFAGAVLRGGPFNVLVQVTNRCNMTCSFCEFWSNGARPEDELTVADYERLSDSLSHHGALLVSIEGGEPTLRPDLPDIVRALARHHLTALFTNGWRMTEDLAARLWKAGLTHCSVSIDYSDPARHDAARGVDGAAERAWRAIEILKQTAPNGGRQVHVMTILMHDNVDDIERLIAKTAALGVGQQITLLSVDGDRRGMKDGGKQLPAPGTGERMRQLWSAHPHVRFLGDYFSRMDDFLAHRAGDPSRALPVCRAGIAGFNLDHLGNLSSCIERIDKPVGNLRSEPLDALIARLRDDRSEIDTCQRCFTACRGIQQALSAPTLAIWRDLAARTRG